MRWNKTINFVVGGVVMFTPGATKRKEINDANAARIKAGNVANAENERKTREAFVNAAKERIEQAASINTRKYEDLREEERIIVYRKLIGTLMSDIFYGIPESPNNDRTRHTLSELLNSISISKRCFTSLLLNGGSHANTTTNIWLTERQRTSLPAT
jgi:hypothetical protein